MNKTEGLDMKMYYTDARIASLMAEWHGVKYIHADLPNGFHPSTAYWANTIVEDKLLPLYIHPDSYSIFEPIDGDFVAGNNGDYYCTGNYVYMDYYHNPNKYPECRMDEIHKRNNKAFFMPEGARR